jgi:hypothetical protein
LAERMNHGILFSRAFSAPDFRAENRRNTLHSFWRPTSSLLKPNSKPDVILVTMATAAPLPEHAYALLLDLNGTLIYRSDTELKQVPGGLHVRGRWLYARPGAVALLEVYSHCCYSLLKHLAILPKLCVLTVSLTETCILLHFVGLHIYGPAQCSQLPGRDHSRLEALYSQSVGSALQSSGSERRPRVGHCTGRQENSCRAGAEGAFDV